MVEVDIEEYTSIGGARIHSQGISRTLYPGRTVVLNAEESDGKVLKERTYLVGWFPTPVGEAIINLDID